jgi:excisionase family DNA binding protein
MELVITTVEELSSLIDVSVSNAIRRVYESREIHQVEKKYLTIKETASKLNVTILTVKNYIKKGNIDAQKIGNRVLIDSEKLEKRLQQVKSLKYKR